MKYVAVCKDMCGNIIEMRFNSEKERNEFVMLFPTQVLSVFEIED